MTRRQKDLAFWLAYAALLVPVILWSRESDFWDAVSFLLLIAGAWKFAGDVVTARRSRRIKPSRDA